MGASTAPFAGRHTRPETLNRAVSDHSDVAFREPKLPANLASCFLRVERQQDDRALAIGEPGEASLEVIDVEGGVWGGGSDHGRGQEGLAQLLAPPIQPLPIFRHRSAHPKDKRRDLIGVANRSASQLLDHEKHHLLGEVARLILVA
jgi:hypothetical protein